MNQNEKNIIFEKSSAKIPVDTAPCRVTCYRDGALELKTSDKLPSNPLPYRKISGEMYVNTDTGEVVFPRKSINRAGSLDSLRRSQKRLYGLIRNNFRDNIDLHAIATFDEPVYDLAVALARHKSFMGRFSYQFPQVEYLMVVEPHQSGAWHCHYLFRNRDGAPLHISSLALEYLWAHGFVKIHRVRDVGRMAGYFAKQDKIERLHFYPPHARLYHRSRGITNPFSYRTSYAHARELVEDRQLVYSQSIHVLSALEDGNTKEINCHTHETWVRKD
jgi:hypothetical protein